MDATELEVPVTRHIDRPRENGELNWEPYNPSCHDKSGGLYLFLLREFGNAPFYVGTAKCFPTRFQTHARYFKNCMRTYLRPSFGNNVLRPSHSDFISQWELACSLSDSMREARVFVPGTESNSVIKAEGSAFWQHSLIKLVSPTPEFLKRDAETLESRVQYDIEEHFKRLICREIDFRIPTRSIRPGKSKLFGRREISSKTSQITNFEITYSLKGRDPSDSSGFFARLMESSPIELQHRLE
jgi:hypothetical protein